jgi:hypothetical protein
MKVLLPYLVGAASTFVVQFLIQVYVVPHVQTRKQRHERWLRDVLDLGELLTTSLQRLATEAWAKQYSFRVLKAHETDPEFDQATVKQWLWERKLAARQATQELDDLVRFRVNWVADRIMALSGDSDQVVKFICVSFRYRMKNIQLAPSEWEDQSDEEFEAFWNSERELRTEMTDVVQKLSYLLHPPRVTWQRRFRTLRRKLASFFKMLWGKSTSPLRMLWRKSSQRFRKSEPLAVPSREDTSSLPSSL